MNSVELARQVEHYLQEYIAESRDQGLEISIEDFGMFLQNVGGV